MKAAAETEVPLGFGDTNAKTGLVQSQHLYLQKQVCMQMPGCLKSKPNRLASLRFVTYFLILY